MRKEVLLLMVVALGLAMVGCETMGGLEPSVRHTILPLRTGQTYDRATGLVHAQASGRLRITPINKVAILPFADYSYQQSFLQPLMWGGNRRITEAIADHFIAHGITVAQQEDVNGVLVADGIIRPMAGQYADAQTSLIDQFHRRANEVATPEFEMVRGFHDQTMIEEIGKFVKTLEYTKEASRQMNDPAEPHSQGVTTALSREKIIELGKMLDVDLIIRGRILEYGLKPPPIKSSVVQIRIYAQDARTGEVVWSNHGEVEVAPQRAFGWRSKDPKGLIDRATQELINGLMADFFGKL